MIEEGRSGESNSGESGRAGEKRAVRSPFATGGQGHGTSDMHDDAALHDQPPVSSNDRSGESGLQEAGAKERP